MTDRSKKRVSRLSCRVLGAPKEHASFNHIVTVGHHTCVPTGEVVCRCGVQCHLLDLSSHVRTKQSAAL